jgi:hypothetical protein
MILSGLASDDPDGSQQQVLGYWSACFAGPLDQRAQSFQVSTYAKRFRA